MLILVKITSIPRVLLLSCSLFKGNNEFLGTFGTISVVDKLWSQWGHAVCAWIDMKHSAQCILRQLHLDCRQPMSAVRQTVWSPTGLLIHLHIYHRVSVSSCHFISVNSTASGMENVKALGLLKCRKNEQLSPLTLSDEQCPNMAGNGYVSPFFLYMTYWNDRRCAEWWILQCSSSLCAAFLQRLNCRTEIHLNVGVQVKLKGFGVWLLKVTFTLIHLPRSNFEALLNGRIIAQSDYSE